MRTHCLHAVGDRVPLPGGIESRVRDSRRRPIGVQSRLSRRLPCPLHLVAMPNVPLDGSNDEVETNGKANPPSSRACEFSEPKTPGSITSLVNRLSAGELLAQDRMFPIVYATLRAIARRHHRDQIPGGLGLTDLVHEAYLKLFGAPPGELGPAGDSRVPRQVVWQSRAHFFGAAARAMEQVIVNAARRERTRRRSIGSRVASEGSEGAERYLELDRLPAAQATGTQMLACGSTPIDLVLLSQALRDLEAQDESLAQLVRLRVYLGQSVETASELLGRSPRSVHRDWILARAWLLRRTKELGGP